MISGLILAAGTSSRLGRPKQLVELAGRPLLQHVVDLADASPLDEIVLVLGHRAGDVARALLMPPRFRSVVNAEHPAGQSTSLRIGLASLAPASTAAVVLLGDQPGVRPEVVAAVMRRHAEGASPIVQASYSGRPGHPTLLARSVWGEAARSSGDAGARSLLARHPEWRALVEVGGAPPDDVDTEEDYRKALRRLGNARTG